MQEVMQWTIFMELVHKQVLPIFWTIAHQLCYIGVVQPGYVWYYFCEIIRQVTRKDRCIYFLHSKNLCFYQKNQLEIIIFLDS